MSPLANALSGSQVGACVLAAALALSYIVSTFRAQAPVLKRLLCWRAGGGDWAAGWNLPRLRTAMGLHYGFDQPTQCVKYMLGSHDQVG